MIHDSGLLF